MMEIPLTNMEGYKVKATPDSYDALIGLGYEDCAMDKETRFTRYRPDWLFVEYSGVINSTSCEKSNKKQAYYHNGHFYDQPYEEPTITEDKVPFPELGDIEEFTGPEWIIDIIRQARFLLDQNRFEQYAFSNLKIAYENGVPVTWKPKEKINRKLHENRALAMAIGRYLESRGGIIKISRTKYLIMVSTTGKTFLLKEVYGWSKENECTLPDDYIIPEQVLQWRKEYEEKGL